MKKQKKLPRSLSLRRLLPFCMALFLVVAGCYGSVYASSPNQSDGAIQFIPAPTEATTATRPPADTSPTRDTSPAGPNRSTDTIGNVDGVPTSDEVSIFDPNLPLQEATVLGNLPKTGGTSLPLSLILCGGVLCTLSALFQERKRGCR